MSGRTGIAILVSFVLGVAPAYPRGRRSAGERLLRLETDTGVPNGVINL